MPVALLRTLGAIPSYYLHYSNCTGRAVQAQKNGRQRARRRLLQRGCSRPIVSCCRGSPETAPRTTRLEAPRVPR